MIIIDSQSVITIFIFIFYCTDIHCLSWRKVRILIGLLMWHYCFVHDYRWAVWNSTSRSKSICTWSFTKDILFDAFKMAYECPVTPKLKSKMAEKGV